MRVAAFDAKQFHRGSQVEVKAENSGSIEKYLGFNSPLGTGAIIPNDEVFTKAFLEKSNELREGFHISENLPFFSSTHLKQSLGLRKAISFADQIITTVQDLISTLHCSYVILPPKKIRAVPVGDLEVHPPPGPLTNS